MTLQRFPYGDNPNIIQQVVPHCQSVGAYLLHDKDGAIVNAIEQGTQKQAEDTMLIIFSRWLREDPDHSWEKLIHCLKECGVDVLAEHLQYLLKEPKKG